MPGKQGRERKPMQRLLPEERGEHGEPAGYVYDLESRVSACQRMSLNGNKVTCRLNQAETWSLGNRRRMIEQEESWRESKLRLATDRHRELLRNYAAYRMALDLAAAAAEQQLRTADGGRGGRGSRAAVASSPSASPFGQYGPDRSYRKLLPLIEAIKKTALNREAARRQQAHALLQTRREMHEVDRRLTSSAVLTFHRHARSNGQAAGSGGRAAAAAPAAPRRNLSVGCSLPPIAEGSAECERDAAAQPPSGRKPMESSNAVVPTSLPRLLAAAANTVRSPT